MAKAYRYESDRITALQELPAVDVEKMEFIKVFEATLLCAKLDITGLTLIDENTVQITFKGGGKRSVDIEADSYGAIIIDVMAYVF